MEYFYKVKLTNNKEVKLKELNLEQYKNLQKICIEDDVLIFRDYTKLMIEELIIGDFNFSEFNIVDIFILLLSIRIYSISDEKGFRSRKDGKDILFKVKLDEIIDKILEIVDDTSVRREVIIDNFVADTVIIDILKGDNSVLAFKKEGKVIYEPKDDDISDFLPICVKNKIDESIGDIKKKYNIELFELVDKNDRNMKINFELSESFIYNFLKVIYKDDLKSLYSNLYGMKKAVGIGFEEHKNITLNEFTMYIEMFNRDQENEREARENVQNGENQIPQVNM